MRALLGVQQQALPFDPHKLYLDTQVLLHLTESFQLKEVTAAAMSLAKDKASGPDGPPNELIQNYWDDLQQEVMEVMNKFYENNLDLHEVNKANVVMIQKKDNPASVHDYRPISIINLIPKLISKVMAIRLRRVLPDLITTEQTAFIKGQQISENFISTREILHHIQASKQSAVFLKLDFAKTFDSVNWDFLINVMEARGFPIRWIEWITTLLKTSSSRVLINGEPSPYFMHKKGLRQGDPLSTMLFNIVVDVLQWMVQVANGTLNIRITNRVNMAIWAL